MCLTYIFGHKNPDSDTICSSLAYSYLKKSLGLDVTPVKLGEINSETKFILQYFKIAEPQTLDTIRTQISDLPIDDAICVSSSISIRAAWTKMKQHSQKSLAVVDETGVLIGMATLSDITRNYMDVGDDALLSKSRTPYKNIIETLEAKVEIGVTESRFVTGRVLVAAQYYTQIKNYVAPGDIVIANIDKNIHEAIHNGADLIICTCGLSPEHKDIEIARRNNCVIISTKHDTFSASMLIRQSIPLGYVMTKNNIITVSLDELKDDVKERMLKTRFRSYPVIDANGKVIGMISRYHLLSRARKQVILVDHNEKSQTAPGIEDAEIIEIIDHHRLGEIQTSNPILMKNEPLGSTATIITSMYKDSSVEIPSTIAGIILSAIISDTLNFQSPTCTAQDIEAANRLAAIADVDIKDLALKIINAGSDLRSKKPDEIIESDLKEYIVGKYKIGIAQVYAIDTENISDLLPSIRDRMIYLCGKYGFSFLLLLITDLNRGGSEAIITGERQDIFFKAFSVEQQSDTVFLPGVLSRKKQVFPRIMSIEDEI
jgi:manganese-dependent inorganic pyrophosphatase